jgi:hypothetical protein
MTRVEGMGLTCFKVVTKHLACGDGGCMFFRNVGSLSAEYSNLNYIQKVFYDGMFIFYLNKIRTMDNVHRHTIYTLILFPES